MDTQTNQAPQQYATPVPPTPPMAPNRDSDETLTIGHWVVVILLTAIPIVGFVMTLIWAFNSTTPQAQRNWARATLIWMLVGAALWLIFFFGGIWAAMLASM
ncbi:MAG: hypothetical protein LKF61_00400 [Eggerthellaceae bacterium]|jgi:hypothetical protein|nr:hypothetical protein [Eggerthellaceae bacterium]MCH4220361.1 hypothetical protein [Eggerthellaceae bacterium]